MSDWAAMINGVQPALAGLDMNMPGFVGYVSFSSFTYCFMLTRFAHLQGVGPQDSPDPSKATNSWWGAALIDMVNNGSVPEARIDDMVRGVYFFLAASASFRSSCGLSWDVLRFHAMLISPFYLNTQVIRTLAAWYKMGQDHNYPDVNFSQLTEATYLNGVLVNEHVKCVSLSLILFHSRPAHFVSSLRQTAEPHIQIHLLALNFS